MTTSRVTTSRRRLAGVLIAMAATTQAGCGGGPFDIASVSGVVTLDGAPLDGATVRFKPQRQSDNPLVGPGSIGLTDAEGRYRLTTHDGASGAVVGPHRVSISTYDKRMVDPKNSDRVKVFAEERVPEHYRKASELSFEVPSGGTNEANFDLTSD